MLLRNSISNTKKFFQRTLQGIKTLFSGSGRGGDHYQRLHKRANAGAPPYSNNITSAQSSFNNNKELDYFYNEFADRWDTDEKKSTKKRNRKKMIISHEVNKAKSFEEEEEEKENSRCRGKNSKRERRIHVVAEKLKEIERMDLSNVDHVLDIEEVLHYYSRLTCPAYLEIVDKFFMDIFAELLGPPPPPPPPAVTPSPRSVNSRPPWQRR